MNRAEKLAKGVCACCTKPATRGTTICGDHQEYRRKWADNRRRSRALAGICQLCDKSAMIGKSTCSDCAWETYPGEVRRSAKRRRRQHLVNVSDDVLRTIAKMPCHYCGGMDERGFNGIDRKNQDQGYVQGNMLPCCWLHNEMKGAHSYEVFLAGLRSVVKHLGPGEKP